jgi:thioredoxin reductase (NADPH)
MECDLLIVGSGPIGIEVAAAARGAGIKEILVDRGQLAQTVVDWPEGSRFFSSPERMAIAGVPLQSTHQELATREEYLAYLRGVVEVRGLSPRLYWSVSAIRKKAGPGSPTPGFEVDLVHSFFTDRRETVLARAVVITTGDMAKPNLLGIPGEQLPHVTHYGGDVHRFFGQRLVVVGGRNSAVETAIRAWRLGAKVAISYRRPAFDNHYVYSRLHLEINLLTRKGAIDFYPSTVPVSISPDAVTLAPAPDLVAEGNSGKTIDVPADFVFLATGYNADASLLRSAGVRLEGDDEVPAYDAETMETNVSGLYVAGTAAAGNQREYQAFVGTSHDHAGKILAHAFGVEPERAEAFTGTIPRRHYPFGWEDIEPE